MSNEMEVTEIPGNEEDNEPVYFAPRRVSVISDIANVLSWFVLVGFVIQVVVEIIGLRSQLTGVQISTLVKNINLYVYLFQHMIIPLLTGFTFFAVLQGISLGLSMLLEADYNKRA